jgi:hypothetical protein
VVLEFELRAFTLARQELYYLSPSPHGVFFISLSILGR